MAPGEACTVPPPPAYSRTVPALPTSLHTRPKRRRGKTRFRKTGLSANRSPAERRSRLAANRRVVLLGPFGEPLLPVTAGTVAAEMPFRFSTKYQDAETGLLYYGYRYYDPITGRWLSRDLIGEEGGLNLYSCVTNDFTNNIDLFGLCGPDRCGPDIQKWLEGVMKTNAASPEVKSIADANGATMLVPARKAGKRIWALNKWRDLVAKGHEWDFKTFLDPASHDSPKSANCPTDKCKGFLTLCGNCYRFDIVANIHFGYVGKAAGFTNIELYKGADVAQIIDSRGRELMDPDVDKDAIQVGIEMYVNQVTLCQALKGKKVIKPPEGCSACQDTWERKKK